MSAPQPLAADAKRYWRTLLVLGRTSNLPTVWSNCVAAWWLAGGFRVGRLFWVLAGGTLLYTGGMFLNDAFDEEFDRRHRPERPIPSGAIPRKEVWFFGVASLLAGLFCVVWISSETAMLALCLVVTILAYDAIHKIITFAPVLMALCRLFLFLLAASAGLNGVTGLALWSAIALAAYIIGLSYLARKESVRGTFRIWPCLLMALPVVLASFVNDAGYRGRFYLLSILLIFWVAQCLRHTFFTLSRNVGRTVSGLLAGIALVDLLAVGGPSILLTLLFILLFAAAHFLQRVVPAT